MSSEPDRADDYLVIGDAPRPTTGAVLDGMLTTLLRQIATESVGSVSGIESVTVESSLDGADIARLTLDLTGLKIGVGSTDAPPSTYEKFGTVQHVEEAVVREFHLRASPLLFQGVEFVLDGTVDDLKFQWAVDDASRLAIGPSAEGTGRLRIQLRAETNQDALVAAATELLQQQVADAGVTVSDVKVELASIGPRAATVHASAKVRKGILSASATFEAKASIDDSTVLRITEPQLSSRNPLVAALLLVTRDKITEAVANPIDLNASLPSSLHLRDVAFDLGERIRVDLTFG